MHLPRRCGPRRMRFMRLESPFEPRLKSPPEAAEGVFVNTGLDRPLTGAAETSVDAVAVLVIDDAMGDVGSDAIGDAIEDIIGDVLDLMPVGLLVVDLVGTVRYANPLALDRLGWSPHDAVGRSLLDVIVADDVDETVKIIAGGSAYFGELLGPVRIRYIGANGDVRVSEFWARELPDRSGYVLIVPEQSTSDLLADAVAAIAHSAPIDEAIELIIKTLAALPTEADACVLRVGDDLLDAIGDWPLGARYPFDDARSDPWALAGRSGLDVDIVELADLAPRLRHAMLQAGYRSLWCRPVMGRGGDVHGVVVAFRKHDQPSSLNQVRRLREIVDVAALAFDQLEFRGTLERAAYTDALTGVASRARLQREIDFGLDRASVVYVDLDGFKQVNDQYGHLAGDAVLHSVAQRISTLVRDDDLVVRIGGDEFVVVLVDTTERDAVAVAERIVSELALPYEVDLDRAGSRVVVVTASAGLCVPSDDAPFDQVLRAADAALGHAKIDGKARLRVA